uniref:Uncharacterized protein n=1 Tax=Rhizophora mucronata TaxID=61149 RepID=A0A2P2QN06_RHIMU
MLCSVWLQSTITEHTATHLLVRNESILGAFSVPNVLIR